MGIVQRDPNQLGNVRDYKWYRSGVDIPGTKEYWKGRSVSDENRPDACGYIYPDGDVPTLYDRFCSKKLGLLCEW